MTYQVVSGRNQLPQKENARLQVQAGRWSGALRAADAFILPHTASWE
jgi:hypothetical protein